MKTPTWATVSTQSSLIASRIKTLRAGLGTARLGIQFSGPNLDKARVSAEQEIERATKEIANIEKELARLKELEGAMEKWEALAKALAEAKANIDLIRGDIEKAQANAI